MSEIRKGLLYAFTCYCAWGLFPIYFKAIRALAPSEILVHRILWSLLFLLSVLAVRKQWSWLSQLRHQKKLLLGFSASALLLSINWLIYIWAIDNNKIIDASLGYFMTPLVNVFLGSLFLKERLNKAQWLSVALAAFGVLWLTLQTPHAPWIGLCLAISFGAYGLLRKTAPLGALEGLTLETMLLFPFALAYFIYLLSQGESQFSAAPTQVMILVLAAGPITAVPLLLFAAAARRIPLASLGLMQYISPSIQLLLGIFIFHEQFSTERLISFAGIWLGLLIYSLDGIYRTAYFQKRKDAEI